MYHPFTPVIIIIWVKTLSCYITVMTYFKKSVNIKLTFLKQKKEAIMKN